MRISVITPVFNGEKYLNETIDSVLSAIRDSDIEYIVIDDGSTDKTSEILKSYDKQITVITQSNQGESAAVNTGFKSALGDFILIVSADDPLFTPEIFQSVDKYFDSNPDLVAWYPDWRIINQSSEVVRNVITDDYSDELLIGRFRCLPGPGTFIRKTAALQIGGRRTKWQYVGDYDFWLRISRVGRIQRRPMILAQWRIHGESTSIAQRGLAMFNERIAVIDEFTEAYALPGRLPQIARANARYHAAQLSFYSNDLPAKKALLRAFYLRKNWVDEARIKVVIFIFLQPLSNAFRPIIKMYLSRLD
jgi:glycosyltransferase involved in cell wall biosynthesis